MRRLPALAAVLAALAACGPDHYAIRDVPALDAAPIVAAERSPVFIEAIEDRSNGAQHADLQNHLQLLGVFDTPLAPVLREALQERLAALGVSSAASAKEAGRSLALSVNSIIINTLETGMLVTYEANVKLGAAVKDPAGRVIARQTVHGHAMQKQPSAGPETPWHQKAIEAALGDALSKVARMLAMPPAIPAGAAPAQPAASGGDSGAWWAKPGGQR